MSRISRNLLRFRMSRKMSSQNYSTTYSRLSEYDSLILGVYKDGSLTETAIKEVPINTQEAIRQQLILSEAKGKSGELRFFHGVGGEDSSFPKRVAVVGLGKKVEKKDEKLSGALEKSRHAAAVGVRALQDQGAKNIGIDILTHEHGAAEGASLALYRYDSLKTVKKPLAKFGPVGNSLQTSKYSWETGLIYGDAQNFARYLAETPANLMTPTIFVENVQSKFKDLNNVEIIVRDKGWVINNNMGAFLSVAQGSDEPLKFLEIHYKGGKEGDKPLALVGKGITFDSGGISIKPSAKMGLMKGDMGGGASVAAAVYGLAKLKVPINIVASIPLCENMPSGKATKPGDVVRAMNGKTIEIDNTDAEGRLILADAIYYTSLTYRPHTLIDIATLTGAMSIALGQVYAGVFTNSKSLWSELSEAGEIAHDPFWRMPLDPGYKKPMTKSIVADFINTGGREGGSCNAAAFLREFVYGLESREEAKEQENDLEQENDFDPELYFDTDASGKIRYAHIDIAGVMDTNDNSGYAVKGMTGRPTRSIIEFARNLKEPIEFAH